MIDSSRVVVFGEFKVEKEQIGFADVTVMVDLIPIAKVAISGIRKTVQLLSENLESDYKLEEIGLSMDTKDSRIFRHSGRSVSIHTVTQKKLLQQANLFK
jgi:hypothetical protein